MKLSSNIVAATVLAAATVASMIPGCGSSGDTSRFHVLDGSADAYGGSDAPLILGSSGGDGGDGSAGQQGLLTIMPLMPVVNVVTGQPLPTAQFTAYLGTTKTAVVWSIDRGELGTIGTTSGLFTAAGTIAGTGNVTAAYGQQKATTTITVQIQTTAQGDPAWSPPDAGGLDAGPGGYGGVGGNGPGGPPSMEQMTTLSGTPTADATVSIIYPYTGTVWPQGLLAPLLQWNPGANNFDSVYVDMVEKNYEYKGYFAANDTPFLNLPIPQQAWDAMTLSNGGDPVTITLVFGQGANAVGPYTETWTVAQASLQGTIYYNSYGTALVTNSDTNDHYGKQYGAGTLAIPPGATSPTLIAGVPSAGTGTGCRVCHTVSADGKSLVTQASNGNASDYSNTVFIDLANDTTGGAGTSLATRDLAFPALYKDGSLLVSGSGGMINGDNSSKLYALPAGTPVAGVTGLPADLQASLPAFSPDGNHVSFNFWAGSFPMDAGALMSDRISLGILDFDGTATFSNPRILYTPANSTGGEPAVTYSSFFPNSAGVVFELELANPANAWGYTWNGNTGELWWVDVASGMAHRLDQLNGYDAMGNIYLPDNAGGAATHTAAQDVTLNYEPTVNPIASGGYAWVVFTSRRMYGNVAQLTPWVSDPRQYPWLDEVTDKKLWVAAVDLNATPGTDPSHPAFYLPAQELHAGNARGYWSVEACRADGQTCQTGDQCCGGYCQPGDGGGLVCSSQMPSCSGQYEKCSTTSDCCGAAQGVTCVNDVCSLSQPPPQ
ncbi:MAG: hypothetical protein ACLP1X_07980 [Polyangiaceae bacterium]